ncbi:hypothetical protein U1E44_03395 [Arenibacter sp. GZD96]|nr:hypothetical protein [Arenibacter sp. GZD-96]MEA1785123.1 hypothetical protein [Arenibacter sp. GZD-96]
MEKLAIAIAILTVFYIVFLYLTTKTLIKDGIHANQKRNKTEVGSSENRG